MGVSHGAARRDEIINKYVARVRETASSITDERNKNRSLTSFRSQRKCNLLDFDLSIKLRELRRGLKLNTCDFNQKKKKDCH